MTLTSFSYSLLGVAPSMTPGLIASRKENSPGRQGRGQERFLDETGLGLLDRGLSSRGVSEERRPFQRLRDDAGNEIEAAELVGAEHLWLRPSEFRCSQHHSARRPQRQGSSGGHG